MPPKKLLSLQKSQQYLTKRQQSIKDELDAFEAEQPTMESQEIGSDTDEELIEAAIISEPVGAEEEAALAAAEEAHKTRK